MIFTSFKFLPQRLTKKIQAVQSEDDAYAADELVELGEEILSQLAAMGIAVYLQQAKQKDVFNDFLISLFLSNGHAYNAGPLYRWAANMIKDAEGDQALELRPFFWQKKEGKEVLNEEIHHLASLRNAVMHGFFVLPPDRNREEANIMEVILETMVSANLFQRSFGSFHFIDPQGFNGHWNIHDAQSWKLFNQEFPFGKLAIRVAHEYADDFRKEENHFASEKCKSLSHVELEVNNLLDKGKGALVCWYQAESNQGLDAYRSAIQSLDKDKYLPIYYALHANGATFTASFLEQEIGKALYQLTSDEKALKEPFKYLNAQKGKLSKKPIVVLHDIHIALFSPNHLTNLFNMLYDLEVPIVATSLHYPYLKRFFNMQLTLSEKNTNSLEQVNISLVNYLRFKGPSPEKETEKENFEVLKKIVYEIHEQLEKNQRVVARRFADENNYPIEYVHEAFGILSPFYQSEKEAFKEDEVDELYGFPKSIEESSRIFLTLGRRDVKLEYQHKVLSNFKQ
jgi:hypothetical protein